MDIKCSSFGDYYIVRARNINEKPLIKQRIVNVLLIDNSGSMGSTTTDATQIIGKGMFSLPRDRVEIVEGSVIIFSEKATILSRTVKTSNDIDALCFPRQGQTNITDGVIYVSSKDDIRYACTCASGYH